MVERRRRRVWAALEGYDVARDWQSHEVHPVLPEELGRIHAFAATETTNRDPEFFAHDGPWAICGGHIKVRLPVSFKPDDDACARCSELVAAGRTANADPRPQFEDCRAVVLPDLTGLPQVVACSRRAYHDGPHRSLDGHTWLEGPDDFTPSRWPGESH